MNSDSPKTVRTRMAPSPTGEYHVGHIATLLKNYAFAHKHGGQFVLRIEDTDQERKVEGAVEKILKVITDYGLDWDEGPQKEGPFGPYVQSERLPLYKQYAKTLIDNDKAYYCFCSKERIDELRDTQRAAKTQPRYDKHCAQLSLDEVATKLEAGESYVIRLNVPANEDITFTDLIRGDITFNSSEVDDQVLMKSDGFPTYHLAVVVDDYLMEISHVMRGEEWISSTPKHVLLYQAFGWEKPIYCHIPVFLNPDGKGKMSKRKGTVSAQSFLDDGYLPEALLNFFMILGWAREDERELMSLDEYIQEFDPARISAKSVVFDLKKLAWVNGQYIRKLSTEDVIKKLKPHIPADFPQEKIEEIVPLVHDRLEKLSDFAELTTFFYQPIEMNDEFQNVLIKKTTPQELNDQLQMTYDALQKIDDWSVESLEQVVRNLQESHDWKKNQYFMMLRVAVTGRKATPPLFETMTAIGKERVLDRVIAAQRLGKTW